MTIFRFHSTAVVVALVTLVAAPLTADQTPSVDAQACIARPEPSCLLQAAANEAPALQGEILGKHQIFDIVRAYAATGNIDAARNLIDGYPELLDSAFFLGPIAESLAFAARDEEAFALLDSPQAQDDPQSILVAIALGQARSGRLDEAGATAAQVTDPKGQARILAATLDLDTALEQVSTLPAETQETFLKDLAIRLARAGQIDAALDAMYMIQDVDVRFDPRFEIAAAQARAGQAEEAIKTIGGIAALFPRIVALLTLMRATPDPLILEEVRNIANGIPESSQSYLVAAMALATIEPDGPFPARVAADIAAIHNHIRGSRATLAYIEMLAAHGSYSTVAALAFGIDGNDQMAIGDRIYALTTIANEMIEDAAAP